MVVLQLFVEVFNRDVVYSNESASDKEREAKSEWLVESHDF